MSRKSTLMVDAGVLNTAPSYAFAVSTVNSNSNGDRVAKPINDHRKLDKISSIVIDKACNTADFLFENGSKESHDIKLQEWWSKQSLVYVFGHSDDLIEFRGSVRKEFNIHEKSRFKIGNTVFIVEYDRDGYWVFEVIRSGSDSTQIDDIGSDMSDIFCDYSQILTVESDQVIKEIDKLD